MADGTTQEQAGAYEVFRRANPATRCFQQYDSATRANHAASFRVGRVKRTAVGEHYYTHPMVGGIAFPTAKAATARAYELWTVAQVCAWLDAS